MNAKSKLSIVAVIVLSLLPLAFVNCSGMSGAGNEQTGQSGDDDNNQSVNTCSDSQLADLENRMTTALQNVTTDHSFYVEFRRPDLDQRVFKLARQIGSDPVVVEDTTLQSASTAKLITATVILDVIANPQLYPGQGKVNGQTLTLDSFARDFLPDGSGGTLWRNGASPIPTTHRLYGVTLRHLLSFTSGVELEKAGVGASCIGAASTTSTHAACVTELVEVNMNKTGPRTYFYNGAHMLIASKIAVSAAGVANWAALFKRFKEAHGVFQGPVTPAFPVAGVGAFYPFSDGTSSPNPAGAMRYRAGDYASFLNKLYLGQIIPTQFLTEMTKNQTEFVGATVEYSPLTDQNEDWRYGLGLWNECPAPAYTSACFGGRYSSPGSFGSYPFMDNNVYDGQSYPLIGFLGRGGSDMGTADKGMLVYRSLGGGPVGVKDLAQQWAANRCQ